MQPSHSLDPPFTTPHAPYSPPLNPPAPQGANGNFNAIPLSNGDGTGAAGMQRTGSALGAAGRPDKGKQVVRDQAADPATEEDEATRLRNVERVLKRAEAAKLARTFRNRLALAGFKAQRGWQDLKLDVIEPHLEQEALKRQGGGQSPANLASPHLHPQLQPQQFAPAPSPYPPQPQYHDQQQYAQQGVYGLSPVGQLHPLPPPPPPQQHHFAGGMDAMLGGSGGPAQKRARHEPHDFSQPVNSYNNASVYAPQPQPLNHLSPYSTSGVYQNNMNAGGSPFVHEGTPRGTKRRLASHEGGGSRIGQASPRARTKSNRRTSPGKGGAQNPLSSSDPHFSSFVDAAAALTGMARAPSDPSQNGSDEDAQQQQQQHQLLGGSFDPLPLPHANGASPFPTGAGPPRPSTPERGGGGAGRQPGAPGGSGGEGTAVEAADLMLFLAQSPSPVQPKKTTNVSLGDGMGMKGRRLFSGMGEPDAGAGAADAGAHAGGDSSIFGGELGGAFGPPATSTANASALDAAFNSSSSAAAAASSALPPPPADPTKTSTAHSSSLAAPLTAQGHSLPTAAPGTPERQRQPSLNGQSWETFINASPSPTRTRRASAAAAAAAAAEDGGEEGLAGGGSPPHAVVGEAQAAW
ncbi:hypothetical protein JCM6882_003647 [Rhodosporidiobolus microsporus]